MCLRVSLVICLGLYECHMAELVRWDVHYACTIYNFTEFFKAIAHFLNTDMVSATGIILNVCCRCITPSVGKHSMVGLDYSVRHLPSFTSYSMVYYAPDRLVHTFIL